ncbi:hypothetical protein LPW11_02975 [Geomonas sp. RF6]|uniref:hypothetical protein n=1 Tax=Geomonas sp. RF6 TaxID=2897342 RepID=UPI001E3F092B|nr:hypothetical protein [Geomonas sp. RF6]UFS71163.1 hypothetical protein LPW11_02975 [Geomonas sp. RF6]
MKRLLLALGLLLIASSPAAAHDRGFQGISFGFPLYYYPTPPVTPYVMPQPEALPRPQTVGPQMASAPNGFYHAPPKVYRYADGDRWIVEEIYKDGRLVERRVKCYPPDWEGYR